MFGLVTFMQIGVPHMDYQRVGPEAFMSAAALAARPVYSVLDIGPGIRPQTIVDARVHICVEPFDQYVTMLSAANPDITILSCTWAEALEILPCQSVDTVVLMDVIEHLPKDEGCRLLEATIGLARSQVIVETPLGFMAQGEDESKDAWGLDGVDWQVHRSGWTPEDFPGWRIIASESFHRQDAYGRLLAQPHGAFFAILDKGPGFEPGDLVRLRHWRRTSDSRFGKSILGRVRRIGITIVGLLSTVAGTRR